MYQVSSVPAHHVQVAGTIDGRCQMLKFFVVDWHCRLSDVTQSYVIPRSLVAMSFGTFSAAVESEKKSVQQLPGA
jgi:hypothetical protein